MQISNSRITPVSDDEIGLHQLWSAVSGGWRTIRWFILAGLVAAAAWLLGYARYNPQMVVYSTAFRFESKGGQGGHYPNGLKFALQDVLSPSVMDAAYNSVATRMPQIRRSDLDAMVSVVPYSPERELVRNRYLRQLSDKGLAASERNQIELDFAKALDEAGPEGTRIDLSTIAGTATPEAAGALFQSMLDNWTRIYVMEYGAARQPGALQSKLLIVSELLEARDYPIIFQNLEKAAGELTSRVAEISELPGTEGIAIGGRTIKDVERDAQQIILHLINEEIAPAAFTGLSRTPESSARKLAYASQTIRDSMAELQAQSRLIDELLAQAEPSIAGQNRQTSGASGTSMTQISDATSDRLIDLAVSNAAQPFKQDLLRQKQELGERTANLATRLARTERLANALSTTVSIIGSQNEDEFLTAAKTAAFDMNRLWAELNAMTGAASATNLNPSRTFYSRVPLPREVTITGGVSDILGWGGAILIILLSIAAGIAVQLLRSDSAVRVRQARAPVYQAAQEGLG